VDVHQFGSRFHIHGDDGVDSNHCSVQPRFTIRGLDDLREIHVDTLADSSTAQYLETNHIDFVTAPRAELFEALRKRKIQAVIYEEPILRYDVRNQYAGQFTVFRLTLDANSMLSHSEKAALCANQ
jgi:ABC-type amino acid transport substrate-binding protein